MVDCRIHSFFRPLSGYPSLPISAPKISNYEPAGDDDSDGDDDHETRIFGSCSSRFFGWPLWAIEIAAAAAGGRKARGRTEWK